MENKEILSISEIESELHREKYREKYRKIFKSTFYALVIVAAFSILVATLLLPILKIYGTSMNPTLYEQDIVVSIKTASIEPGDVVAFYYNNHILVKRVIATPGQTVVIDKDGNVFVNGAALEEPYIIEKSFGESNDTVYPYVVPDHSYFLLGDHRTTALDSRNSSIGSIDKDEIVGKVVYTVWPMRHFGKIK